MVIGAFPSNRGDFVIRNRSRPTSRRGATAAYLTRWRMGPAAVRLRDTVGAVARSLGYTSEYAFKRALTRDRYIPSGRYRTYSRATQPPTPSAYPAGQRRGKGMAVSGRSTRRPRRGSAR